MPDKNKGDFHKILTCGLLEKKKKLVNKKNQLRTYELLRKYYRIDFIDSEEMYPLAIYPQHLDERMSAQQACFTIFGNKVNGMHSNNSKEKFLDYICISANSKLSILKELNRLGISSYSVFPDLDGLGKTINQDHGLQFDETKIWDTLYHFSDKYKA